MAAISIEGALPANAREWEEYSARFDRSISDGLPAGRLRPDDETAWKAVAKNYDVTTKITNLESGYWGIITVGVRPSILRFDSGGTPLITQILRIAELQASPTVGGRYAVARRRGRIPSRFFSTLTFYSQHQAL